MNIFNHITTYNNQQSQTIQPSRESDSINTSSDLAQAVRDIRELVVGKIFQGEITDIRNNQVFIGLSNGQTIMAKLSSPMDLYIGQTLSFQIKSNNGSQIEIKPRIYNLMQNPTLLKALEAASLPVNEKNTNMVKYLMEAQMPIDKESLHGIHKQSTLYPDADIKSIIQLNKLQIPVTKENLAQFENYKNYEHRIAKGIEDISLEIPKVLELLSENGEYSKALSFQKEVFGILSNITKLNTFHKNPDVLMNENSLNTQEALLESTKKDTNFVTMENGKTWSDFTDRNLTNSNATTIRAEDANLEKIKELSGEKVTELVTTSGVKESGIGRFMSMEARETLVQKLQSFSLSEETLVEIQKGTISEAGLLEKIALSFEIKGTSLGDDVKELFRSKEYQKILQEFVKETWLLKPEDLLKEESVKEFYKKLDYQLTQLNQLVNQMNQEYSSLSKYSSSLKDNMDFMNQLNQMYTYIQIPLKLKNQTVHSELYVYTNKKSLAKKDGNISVLLHLDMEALGAVDVYINLASQNLNTRFYLDNEESVKLIEENIETLNSKLVEKGYHCSSSVMIRQEDINYVEDFLAIDDNEGTMKRYTFDVRT